MTQVDFDARVARYREAAQVLTDHVTEALGLPTLEGSEADVAVANRCRARILYENQSAWAPERMSAEIAEVSASYWLNWDKSQLEAASTEVTTDAPLARKLFPDQVEPPTWLRALAILASEPNEARWLLDGSPL